MRVTENYIQNEYLGGLKISDVISYLNFVMRQEDDRLEYAKRMRAWVSMCYRKVGPNRTKFKGGICDEWLNDPEKAIAFMIELSGGRKGRFRRVSAIQAFGPDNLTFVEAK